MQTETTEAGVLEVKGYYQIWSDAEDVNCHTIGTCPIKYAPSTGLHMENRQTITVPKGFMMDFDRAHKGMVTHRFAKTTRCHVVTEVRYGRLLSQK